VDFNVRLLPLKDDPAVMTMLTTWLWRGLAFTDDAAVLNAVFGLASHIKPVHSAAAARALGKEINKT
jgi:hypothetical protein